MRFFARLSLALALLLSGLLPVEAQSLSRPLNTDRSRSGSEFLAQLLPLDAISTPVAAAYSARKLRAAYAGPTWRVRNSSNVEADIGFASIPDAAGNYWIDTTALLAHVGSGSGFLVTWYDQSGNGRHAVQTTAASQPRIANAGVVENLNGRFTATYSGTQWLVATFSSPIAHTAGLWLNAVAARSAATDGAILDYRDTVTGNPIANIIVSSGSFSAQYRNNAGALAAPAGGPTAALITAFILSDSWDGSNALRYANGILRSTTATTGTRSMQRIGIGTNGFSAGGFNFSGAISEITLGGNQALPLAARQALERNQGAAFGITIP